MSYDYEFKVEPQYIRIDISGERVRGKEVESAVEMLSRVAAKCRETGCTRVLAVSRVKGPINILSVFQIAKNPEKYGWQKRFRFAYVDQNEESQKEVRLGETIAANSGFRLTKVFDREDDAIKWLLNS